MHARPAAACCDRLFATARDAEIDTPRLAAAAPRLRCRRAAAPLSSKQRSQTLTDPYYSGAGSRFSLAAAASLPAAVRPHISTVVRLMDASCQAQLHTRLSQPPSAAPA